jgi:flavin reductase (DIM6/NTAB) family NADH-FMN oxidoreductase RutF
MGFVEKRAEDLMLNPFKMFKENWVLITAGTDEKFNTMTAGWGGLGVYLQKNAATVYIRPQRYTKEFVDNNECFSITAFSNDCKEQLTYLGRVSGRDEDKIQKVGYTVAFDKGVPYIQEGNMVFICRKILHCDILGENFANPLYTEKAYPSGDYHMLYIAEIEKVLVKE